MIVRYTLLWLPMVIIAITNGVIRDAGYGRCLGELAAHQVPTPTGLLLFGIYIWAIGLRWKLETAGQAVAIGLIWLSLTLAFEFLFFHYVVRHPWSRLLNDYNILNGRVWIFVLIFITVAPYLMYTIRKK